MRLGHTTKSASVPLRTSSHRVGLGSKVGSGGKWRTIDGEELGLGAWRVPVRRVRGGDLLGDLLRKPIAAFLAHTAKVEGERLRPG